MCGTMHRNKMCYKLTPQSLISNVKNSYDPRLPAKYEYTMMYYWTTIYSRKQLISHDPMNITTQ